MAAEHLVNSEEISYKNTGSSIGGNEDILEFSVTDKNGAVSTFSNGASVNPFTASEFIGHTSCRVKPTTVESGSDLDDWSFVEVQTFTFNADSMMQRCGYFCKSINDGSIDGLDKNRRSRYKYDPSITSDRISLIRRSC